MLKFQKGDKVNLIGDTFKIPYEIESITIKGEATFYLKSTQKHSFANGLFDYIRITALSGEISHAS
ncbi:MULTISPECIES: hypothetical protein [Bacillus cereus group]|uniref:Uncharacterized protein n=1 Tax=Bacillus thuringiensis TaxID=1428 RepID=A0A9X7ASL7_BACTU|nr:MULTISPECIES: hypothetical protein [Bacillus cereus group]EKS7858179.1 hypothetical protein [Bacillus cereus]PFT50878.1 hypothetical protein COK72_02395 [Bacillus thuringiensis]PFY22915.1 hypothetical protein COL44_18715 [Bacillus toyonensis]